METEEDAKDTLLDLRIKKRMYRGQPVKGRLKSESMVKSFYPSFQPTIPAVPMMLPPFNGFMPPPAGMMYPYGIPPEMGFVPNIELNENGASTESYDAAFIAVDEVVKDLVNSAAGGGTKKKSTPTSQSSTTKPAVKTTSPNENKAGTQGNNGSSNGSTKDKKTTKQPSKTEDKKPVIDNSPLHFPPLVPDEQLPVATPGYKGSFVKYSFDDIINIVGGIKHAKLPDSIVPVRHRHLSLASCCHVLYCTVCLITFVYY
jgi:hypothetical protein